MGQRHTPIPTAIRITTPMDLEGSLAPWTLTARACAPWPCSSPRNPHSPLLLGKLMIPSPPDVQQHNLPTSMPVLTSASLSIDRPPSVPLHSLQFWWVSDVQLILVDRRRPHPAACYSRHYLPDNMGPLAPFLDSTLLPIIRQSLGLPITDREETCQPVASE